MTVHDWTRVNAGIFHDCRFSWVMQISGELNSSLLPDTHYALLERPPACSATSRPTISLQADSREDIPIGRPDRGGSAIAIREQAPQVRFAEDVDAEVYSQLADRIAVYRSADDCVIAYIEIVSPGNKNSPLERDHFFTRLDQAIERCCHLLVIDILPPGRHDPKGMHAAFWERSHGSSHGCTEDEPLGLSAYRVDIESEQLVIPRAYFQPLKVGDPLPDMPLFLTEQHYVNVPLEETYQQAWTGVPQKWKQVIDS